MASQKVKLHVNGLVVVATGDSLRQLTVFDSEERQVRNGRPLISLQALVIDDGDSLGVVTVQTSERDLPGLASGVVLAVRGRADITTSGTRDEWGLRSTVYIEELEPTQVNAWSVLTETVRRAAQAAAK